MTLKPLSDRVILKTVKAEETTKGGIILAASAQEKPVVAEVVAVGPGGMVDGNEVVMTVKPGDRVITSKYSGTEVKVDDEEYTIVRPGRHPGHRGVKLCWGNRSPWHAYGKAVRVTAAYLLRSYLRAERCFSAYMPLGKRTGFFAAALRFSLAVPHRFFCVT